MKEKERLRISQTKKENIEDFLLDTFGGREVTIVDDEEPGQYDRVVTVVHSKRTGSLDERELKLGLNKSTDGYGQPVWDVHLLS